MIWAAVIVSWTVFVTGMAWMAWRLRFTRRDEENGRDRFGAGRRG